MGEPILTSYADFAAMIEGLPVVIRSARRMRGLSLRAAAKEIGTSASTIMRIEDGHDFDSGTLTAVLRWLDDATRGYTHTGQEAADG